MQDEDVSLRYLCRSTAPSLGEISHIRDSPLFWKELFAVAAGPIIPKKQICGEEESFQMQYLIPSHPMYLLKPNIWGIQTVEASWAVESGYLKET